MFDDIKNEREMKLFQKNQIYLERENKIKKQINSLHVKKGPIEIQKLISILNEITDDNRFDTSHFNHYQSKYLHAMESIKRYQKLCEKSSLYIKNQLKLKDDTQENISIDKYKEQNQTITQTNMMLRDELQKIQLQLKNKENNNDTVEIVNNLNTQVESLNATIKEHEMANNTLEMELNDKQDDLDKQTQELKLAYEELKNIEENLKNDGSNLEDELSLMIEKLIIDQHMLINKIEKLESEAIKSL
jgi:hypothetical protein